MDISILPKQNSIPDFDPSALAVKYIEYYLSNKTYEGKSITPDVIARMLQEVSKGINAYFYLDPAGESDWMEVVSDGEWLFLFCCFEGEDGEPISYLSYNPEFADTVEQIEEADFSDERIYTPIESGGQSPIPKIHAIQDMELGIRAVDYFIHTGMPYPGLDWLQE